MKNLIFISALFLISCVDRSIEIIDGCEYIKTTTYGDGTSQSLAHKGNCRNPIHNNKIIVDTNKAAHNNNAIVDTTKVVPVIKYYDLSNLKKQ